MPTRHPGPFLKYFFIPAKQIEYRAEKQLCALGLMPSSPGPVAIERYCDKRWGFPEDYVDLPQGVLGDAVFSEKGLETIRISRALAEDSSPLGVMRTRSTIAHEIGHGELHAEHYAAKLIHDNSQHSLFTDPTDQSTGQKRIATACREGQIFGSTKDEWWETQANKFMAALLMPPTLLRQVFDEWNRHIIVHGRRPVLPLDMRISAAFRVSQQMATIAARELETKWEKEGGLKQLAAFGAG